MFMHSTKKSTLQGVNTKLIAKWRFTNNVLVIWPHGEKCLKDFVTETNTVHPMIKWYAMCSYRLATFLDGRVSWVKGKLIVEWQGIEDFTRGMHQCMKNLPI